MKSDNSSSSYVTPGVMQYYQKNQVISGTHPSLGSRGFYSGGTYQGTGGVAAYYQNISQIDPDTLIEFTRKLFSFFSLQKIFLAIFIIYTYNNLIFTQYIATHFIWFAISGVVFLSILMMVHSFINLIK